MLHLKDESCVHVDKHMLSTRPQSPAILSVVGKDAVATSASTVFHKRQKFTLTALEKCEAALNTAEAQQLCYDGRVVTQQLCYDGRVVSKADRYIFLVKVLVPIKPSSQSMLWLLNLFSKTSSVTGEAIFATIVEQIWAGYINKIVCVMANITAAVDTGKNSGVNVLIKIFFQETIGHGINTLEFCSM